MQTNDIVCDMPGRKKRLPTDDEALREYRMREKIERGEKLSGEEADWLDRRGTAANAARRSDALTRHSKLDERGGA
jgi:hypothetical protein